MPNNLSKNPFEKHTWVFKRRIGLNTMPKKLTMEHDVIVNRAQAELLEYCGELSKSQFISHHKAP